MSCGKLMALLKADVMGLCMTFSISPPFEYKCPAFLCENMHSKKLGCFHRLIARLDHHCYNQLLVKSSNTRHNDFCSTIYSKSVYFHYVFMSPDFSTNFPKIDLMTVPLMKLLPLFTPPETEEALMPFVF